MTYCLYVLVTRTCTQRLEACKLGAWTPPGCRVWRWTGRWRNDLWAKRSSWTRSARWCMWMRRRSAGWWCHACGTSCSAPPWCSVRRERWCHFCTYKLHCSILFNNLNVTLLNPPQHFLVLIIIHSLLPYFIGYLQLSKLCIFSACYDGVKILTHRRILIERWFYLFHWEVNFAQM